MFNDAMRNATWPDPADPAAASRLLERVAAADAVGAALAASAAGRDMLRALGGNAPYLADLAVREWPALVAIAAQGPGVMAAQALRELAATSRRLPRARISASLRQAKRIVALATAVADIGGLWRLAEVTGTLSELADTALRLAVEHLLLAAHAGGSVRLPHPDSADPGAGSGLIVLAMGKLGASELNYSSDIDLMLLHDPEAGVVTNESSSNPFIRMTRDIVTLLEQRDANGYVFRTDLRLRPDPAATPPCVALPAALAYYEGMAQNWERAALLKARPVAGDLAVGAGFLAAIRPFVWRRGLDFAALADLHAMKRRIDEHKGTALALAGDPVARVAGHNVKLGQGGIREIEFVAQTLQLVWGGREPALRVPGTIPALRLLARSRRLGARAAGELIAAYRFLRRVEHRLQMVADRQTHTLPDTAAGVADFAVFMGVADPGLFAAVLLRHLRRVQRRYAEVFVQVPDATPDPQPALTAATLAAQGFAEPGPILAAIAGWRAGRLRALRSERARDLLDQVLPGLLRALARQARPDAAFARLDTFFGRLPAGVQPLSLFHRNPQLLERVAAVLGASPALADHLANNPAALDGLLSPSGRDDDTAAWLADRLRDAPALEDAIAIIRRTVREADFAISVATLEGRLDADAGGLRRAGLADAAIAALLPFVLADVERRHGVVPGGAVAVVLLGKAGGREMMAGSDIDLMLVYDHPAEVTASVVGASGRIVAPSQWFVRAVQSFVAALTAPDAGGALYAVDMRLRPSGNKGPVAVSLAAFQRYHMSGGDAWTWERMALTRARVVAGPDAFRARLRAAIRAALESAGEPAQVRADAAAMRTRMLRELPGGSAPSLADAKLRRGGLVEVEFVAQVLQLVNAGADVLDSNTCAALDLLALAGALPPAEAAMLARADRAWRSLQGMLRLTIGPGGMHEDALAPASVEALLHAMRGVGVAAVDLAGLRRSLDAVADEVRAAFARHVGKVEA